MKGILWAVGARFESDEIVDTRDADLNTIDINLNRPRIESFKRVNAR